MGEKIAEIIVMLCFGVCLLAASVAILATAVSILDMKDIVRPVVEQLLK